MSSKIIFISIIVWQFLCILYLHNEAEENELKATTCGWPLNRQLGELEELECNQGSSVKQSVRVKSYLPRRKNLLVPDNQMTLFSSPVLG